jgi:hypothetical protein
VKNKEWPVPPGALESGIFFSRIEMRKPWHAPAAPAAKAYHEAGHVVVAYAFGGQVRRGGVRSAAWAHGWHPNFVTANVCVLMAGYLAEEKFQGHHWRWEEDVIKELRAVRSGHNEDVSLRGNPTDVRAIAQALFEDSPPTAPADARRLVTYCRQQTSALLDELRVWGGVERLAQALLRHRYLSPSIVKQLLDEVFAQRPALDPARLMQGADHAVTLYVRAAA